MDIESQKQLVNLCEFPQGLKWELKYRASRDGFKASDFHSNCDGIANTLTVIKVKSGNIFGGFTEQAWQSRAEFVTDPKAFIFSLINKEKNPFKVMCSNEGEGAIICSPTNGPWFGINDIWIGPNSNLKRGCFNFGNLYQHPDYKKNTDKAKNIIAGSITSEIVGIEVFANTI